MKLAPFFLLACCAAAPAKADPARVTRLLERAVVLDLHDDTTQMMVDEGYDLAERHDFGQVDLPRMREGHVAGVFLSIWTDAVRYTPTEAIRRALDQIDAVARDTTRHPREMALTTTADQVLQARKRGQIAILMGVEGGHMIDSDLAILRTYFRLGVRYMTLTHTEHTPWADTASHPAAHSGLTDFGKQVVREMNRLGLMVDISHVSDKTFYDALEASRAPVIASHSSMRALCNIPRNMSDDMLRALARQGGVVFINFNTAYLDEKAAAVFAPLREARDREIAAMLALNRGNPRRWEMVRAIQQRYKAQLPAVDITAVLRHIDHAVKTMGADHVGIGSDFDGVSGMVPDGMEDVSKYPALVQGLIDRGYSDADIAKIMGGNLLRVMRANEAVARQMDVWHAH